ncbi:MAG TPA: hypothetical protein VHM70_19055 [Polyangiaceae bacterium]|jgi:hypothetical protein|nr:hypothetical protein [Polyangiaceae bacterium]
MAPASIVMGLNPTISDDAVLADLDVTAFDSRATTVTHSWGSGRSEQQDVERAAWYQQRGVAVLFAVDGVRGALDIADVDWAEREDWAKAALDELFDSDLVVQGVVIGDLLDVSLDLASAAVRTKLTNYARELLDYANEHPARRQETLVGISTDAAAWSEPSVELRDLASRVSLVTLSENGLDRSGTALSSDDFAHGLISQLQSAHSYAANVWLREVSYPSSRSAASSLEQQAAALDALWAALELEPKLVPFLTLSSLYDPIESECDAFRRAYRFDDPAASARCSIGLRAANGDTRPAFASVVTGFATLSQR